MQFGAVQHLQPTELIRESSNNRNSRNSSKAIFVSLAVFVAGMLLKSRASSGNLKRLEAGLAFDTLCCDVL
jgi:hypothetical protein